MVKLSETRDGTLRLKIEMANESIIETSNQSGDQGTMRTFEKLVALMNGEPTDLPDAAQGPTTT